MSDRVWPPHVADEKQLLSAFLDFNRETIRIKCADLSPAQLVQQPSPPAQLSLLGLVRHLTEVESSWFSQDFAGDPEYRIYKTTDDFEADMAVSTADSDSVAAAFERFAHEVATSRAIVARSGLEELAVRPDRDGEHPSLRWIMLHMIEEYARHNGHADLLREAIDGVAGF